MKIISKIIETILNIIIIFVLMILLIALYYVAQTKIMHKDYANIWGYTGFEVITGSMSGTIEVGDVVIVKLTNEIQENDIIVYKEENSFITHRIIKIDNNSITTKGDANNSEDKQITKEQVIGKVIKIIPKISIWKKVLSTPAVLISAITTILLFGFVFSYESKNVARESDNKKKEHNNDK